MKTAIVLGCAECVWLDMRGALDLMGEPDMYVAVNHMGTVFKAEHWASVHIDMFPDWIKARQENGLTGPMPQLWVNETKLPNLSPDQARLGFKGAPYNDGTSSELGAWAAIISGADRVVFCGVPLINGPHYYSGSDFDREDVYRYKWTHNHHKFEGKLRSMSGWTAELLGRPDRAWIAGES